MPRTPDRIGRMPFYSAVLILLFPFIYALLWLRRLRGKESPRTWQERWGHYPVEIAAHTGSPRFWVHAVSVGEVMASVPVLRALRARFPDALILLSTTTIGGREVAEKQAPPADYVVAFPLDFPGAVKRALNAVRPDAVILMEWGDLAELRLQRALSRRRSERTYFR